MTRTTRFALLSTLLLGACATSAPEAARTSPPAPEHASGPELASARPAVGSAAPAMTTDAAAITAAARQFVQAKIDRDFGAIWDQAATVYRGMIVDLGKKMAEGDRHIARAQGFGSPEAIAALSARDYFIQRRQHLAEQGKSVYGEGVTISSLEIGPVIHLPFPGERVAAHPVTVTLSDGSRDKIAAIEEGGAWRFLEK